MKILHIIPELNKGGAERLVVDMCMELSQRPGIEAYLVVFRPKNDYAVFSKDLDIRVIPSKVVPSLTKPMTIEVTDLQHWIDTFQPDVIHSHLFETEMVLSQVNCGSALRVMHFHDNMPQLEPFSFRTLRSKKALTNWYERQIILKAWKSVTHKMALTISRDTSSYAKRVLPQGNKVQQLLNGIVVERFTPLQTILSNELTLCMIGSLVPKKGQELAIRTVAALHKMGLPFQLHLVGEGPLRDDLKTHTANLNLSNHVHFHGNVDHPEDFLHRSMIYLHTAYYEPLGLVILEAMAAGVPVVSLDGGGNRDIIKHGENGFLLTNPDPDEFASLISQLASDPAYRKQIAKTATEFVKDFDISIYVDRLLEIYRS
jgi:glycosyltransferase involved in cell wall biosynthesis